MRLSVDAALARMPRHRGGRPTKHEFRAVVIAALAGDYHWFFDQRPTSSPEGQFHNFCHEIFVEMDIEVVGLPKAIAAVFKKIGFLSAR
jgi:hypothetical protein